MFVNLFGKIVRCLRFTVVQSRIKYNQKFRPVSDTDFQVSSACFSCSVIGVFISVLLAGISNVFPNILPEISTLKGNLVNISV